jgi:L-lactate utilization protein LutB
MAVNVMSDVKQWHMETTIQRTLRALENNGFTVKYVANIAQATEAILHMIPTNALVGVGGSITVRELGLVAALQTRGTPVAQHWGDYSSDERMKIRRQQLTADVFLTSSNAITENGQLVNVDGAGQRVAAMIFGPKQVIVVAGVNKIVMDLNAAIDRINNIAAPINAKRLNRKTPCATTGVCSDCESSERICNITTIIEKRPALTNFTVVLVGEELGY